MHINKKNLRIVLLLYLIEKSSCRISEVLDLLKIKVKL